MTGSAEKPRRFVSSVAAKMVIFRTSSGAAWSIKTSAVTQAETPALAAERCGLKTPGQAPIRETPVSHVTAGRPYPWRSYFSPAVLALARASGLGASIERPNCVMLRRDCDYLRGAPPTHTSRKSHVYTPLSRLR